MRETFATAFNCMDGRTQLPVARFIQERTGAQFVDTITEPGMEKHIVTALKENNQPHLEVLKNKLLISTNLHDSLGVVVAGHDECAGNPVDRRLKEAQIAVSAIAITEIANAEGVEVPVYAAFVNRSAEGLWVANEIPLGKPTTIIDLKSPPAQR